MSYMVMTCADDTTWWLTVMTYAVYSMTYPVYSMTYAPYLMTYSKCSDRKLLRTWHVMMTYTDDMYQWHNVNHKLMSYDILMTYPDDIDRWHITDSDDTSQISMTYIISYLMTYPDDIERWHMPLLIWYITDSDDIS